MLLDLVTLKTRGYNVDRILRARAAEARIAEQARQQREEERSKALAAEAAREAEADKKKKSLQTTLAAAAVSENNMQRGSNYVPSTAIPPAQNNFFRSFTRHLGFDYGQNQARQQAGGSQQGLLGDGNAGGDGAGETSTAGPLVTQETSVTKRPGDAHRPTKPHVLKANLHSAIKASRAHDSSHVFSPAVTTQVKEQKTYCDAKCAPSPSHLT